MGREYKNPWPWSHSWRCSSMSWVSSSMRRPRCRARGTCRAGRGSAAAPACQDAPAPARSARVTRRPPRCGPENSESGRTLARGEVAQGDGEMLLATQGRGERGARGEGPDRPTLQRALAGCRIGWHNATGEDRLDHEEDIGEHRDRPGHHERPALHCQRQAHREGRCRRARAVVETERLALNDYARARRQTHEAIGWPGIGGPDREGGRLATKRWVGGHLGPRPRSARLTTLPSP